MLHGSFGIEQGLLKFVQNLKGKISVTYTQFLVFYTSKLFGSKTALCQCIPYCVLISSSKSHKSGNAKGSEEFPSLSKSLSLVKTKDRTIIEGPVLTPIFYPLPSSLPLLHTPSYPPACVRSIYVVELWASHDAAVTRRFIIG